MHYIDEGEGRPVVMVHGNPTWSFFFRGLGADLRHDHRIIIPDHVGMGLSDKPDDAHYRYDLNSRAADLEALLEQAGVDRDVTLVLHDWGGMIGMAWACRHPERVSRLVILNTAAFLPPKGLRLPWSLTLARSALGAVLVRGLNLFSLGAAAACARRPLTKEVRSAYLSPYSTWADRRAVHRFVQDIPMGPGHPSYEAVRGIDAGLGQFASRPMLICWGGRDFVFNGLFLQEWVLRFPRARVEVFPDAGHFVLEDAGGLIAPLVREFLESA